MTATLETKICPKCGEEKKVPEDFRYRSYGNKKGELYLHSYCYECQKALSRAFKKTPRGRASSRHYARNGSRYSIAQRDARWKHVSFSLTREEYSEIRNKPCHYCDGPLPETGLGMDRIDGKQGYEPSNVLPCCSWCNTARNRNFTVNEMETFIGPAIKQIRLNRAMQRS